MIVFLNFYEIKVRIESDWDELIWTLLKDFSSFECNTINNSFIDLNLKIEKKSCSLLEIPKSKLRFTSKNSKTYQVKKKRFNDYYGKVKTIFDYESNQALICGEDFDRVHEVAYLMILSRVGKLLDLNGMHKVHAFAVSYKDSALLCMMPSGGGKSTLLLNLLKHKEIKLISDDIPMIDRDLNLVPFPLKIGLVENAEIGIEVDDPEDNIYYMKREFYGNKKLICLNGLKKRIEKNKIPFNKLIIAEGFRTENEKTYSRNVGFFRIWKGLFIHGIIGIGTPIIIEYFWEFGLKDFFTKFKIFRHRCYTLTKLAIKSKKMHIFIGKNSENNAKEIIKILENQNY